MTSQTTAIWAGATGAAVVVAGAAALYIAHPSFLSPAPAPAVVVDRATSPSTAASQTGAASVAAAEPAAPAAPPPPPSSLPSTW